MFKLSLLLYFMQLGIIIRYLVFVANIGLPNILSIIRLSLQHDAELTFRFFEDKNKNKTTNKQRFKSQNVQQSIM